jgi:glycosyltransferase involved in cell wall biosynthesis
VTGTRRLLVLAPFPPRLDADHGGGRAVAQLLQLHAASNRVVLLALRRPGERGVDGAVAAACEHVEVVENAPVGRSAGVAWRERGRALELARGRPRWVASVTNSRYRQALVRLCAEWRPDIVQAELGVMATYLPSVQDGTPRVLVEHDPGVRRAGAVWSRHAWRRFARAATSSADAVVVFSDEDAAAERQVIAKTTLLERIPVPWPVPARALDPVGGRPPTVLFVGNFRHGPNREAARRLARLLPEWQRRHPDVVLALVGDDPPRELERPGIAVPGRVDDLTPWLDDAAVVVAPLTEGGGVRVKVVEALAAGKAVVGTPRAFEGLSVEAGRDALVERDDAGFVAAVAGLLDDPLRRGALAAAARLWAEALPSAASIGAAYDSLYARLEAG